MLEELIVLAENGDVNAQWKLGFKYYNGQGVEQDYTKAFHYWKMVADKGYPEAQYYLGFLYSKGQCVEQDYAKAAYYYELAAKQGHASSQYNLGLLYYNGGGVEQDYAKAAYYFELAAKQGDASAQYSLGVLYNYGCGIEKDYAKAAYYYELAAKQGVEKAQKELNKLKNLEHTEIDILPLNELIIKAKALEKNGNIPLAIKCYQKAIQKGSMESCNDLGTLYINCAEKERDSTAKSKLEKDAFQLIETAAKSGIKLAYRNLGVMMYQGTGCVKDVGSAIYWLTLADKTDDIVATQLLVSIYSEQGEYQKALPYVEKLAYNGNSDAQLMLGLAYYDGDIYQEDKEQAMYWLALSAKQGNEAAIESLKDIIEEQKSKKTRIWNSIKRMLFHGAAGVASEIDYIEADVEDDIVVDSVNMGIGECIENILNAVGDKYEKKDIKRKY